MSENQILISAQNTLQTEIGGLQVIRARLSSDLGKQFQVAVDLLRVITGRVIVTGMGKSGHIGSKIAATLASTGTPAYFVHPAEASHGDLGMIRSEDAILSLSWSGETAELASIIQYSRRFKVPLIAMTSGKESALAKSADCVLSIPKVEEACPHGLAPTTSTIVQLAIGDALAIALLEARGFTAEDFRDFHPGGRLGASLQHVRDVMHDGDELPLVGPQEKMSDVLMTMTEKRFGCAGVVNDNFKLCGIITDGDLRRHMADGFLDRKASDVMTDNPLTIAPHSLVATALQIMNERKLSVFFVVEDEKPLGIVHMHDLLRAGGQ